MHAARRSLMLLLGGAALLACSAADASAARHARHPVRAHASTAVYHATQHRLPRQQLHTAALRREHGVRHRVTRG